MTSGSPMKLILGFSIPLLFGNLFQQFYSIGRYHDRRARAWRRGRLRPLAPPAPSRSSSSASALAFAAALPSRWRSASAAGDYKELRRFIGNAVWLCVGFGIVLTVLTVIFCRNILEFMDTPADIIDDAYAYLVVIFCRHPRNVPL